MTISEGVVEKRGAIRKKGKSSSRDHTELCDCATNIQSNHGDKRWRIRCMQTQTRHGDMNTDN